jgi:RNase P subunit RPR2
MTRRHDVRRVKSHLCYSVAETAALFNVREATVRKWVREGLTPIDDRKPYLFSGMSLAAFVAARNKPRQPLEPGQVYCVACKGPVVPAGKEVIFEVRSETAGDLVGTCGQCQHRVFRRVRRTQVQEKAGSLVVRYEDGTTPVSADREPPRSERCLEEAVQ